ncbi:hypothetical protein O9992_21820 [Vibrio lentus]|nr:hypothetical protein [Vibrio lentus]
MSKIAFIGTGIMGKPWRVTFKSRSRFDSVDHFNAAPADSGYKQWPCCHSPAEEEAADIIIPNGAEYLQAEDACW